MNINDMIKNMNPAMLSQALGQISNMLTPQQMQQIEKAIKTTDKGELNKQLNHLSAEQLQRELRANPNIAKQLANNPEIMKQINQLFSK